MIARVTTAEIDTVRTSVDDAVDVFRESVLPALHEQPGYEGSYVLLSPEGKALVITFWATTRQTRTQASQGLELLRGAGREVRHRLPLAARSRVLRRGARGGTDRHGRVRAGR